MDSVARNLQVVNARIEAATKCARQRNVCLLAVSKGHPSAAIRAAYQAGQRAFGESYVQEALAKAAQLHDLPIEWHFIGPVQSNKTKAIAENFAWVHSVDRLKVAQRLSAARPVSFAPLQLCLQVNISAETGKSGCAAAETPALALEIARLPRTTLRGLMTLPAPAHDEASRRDPFRRMRTLFERINADGLSLDTLSMGMSQDLEAAIAEGATIVRVGSAIFGQRARPGVEE